MRVQDESLCSSCRRDLVRNLTCCRQCARPLPVTLNYCGHCQQYPPAFDRLYAPWRYSFPLDQFIRRWKFGRCHEFAAALAELLITGFDQSQYEADMLVPIPLHWRRLLWRGFNQAEVLTATLAQARGVCEAPRVLRRVVPTKTQSMLPRAARIANVKEAFCARAQDIAGLRIVLIDDVVTSGATMEAAAGALRAAGAKSVRGLALARA